MNGGETSSWDDEREALVARLAERFRTSFPAFNHEGRSPERLVWTLESLMFVDEEFRAIDNDDRKDVLNRLSETLFGGNEKP